MIEPATMIPKKPNRASRVKKNPSAAVMAARETVTPKRMQKAAAATDS